MKSIEELVSEEAKKRSPIEKWMTSELSYSDRSLAKQEQDAFRAGAHFATNLVFERVVEALRKVPNMHERTFRERCMTHAEVIDWLKENRDRILGKNEQGTKEDGE